MTQRHAIAVVGIGGVLPSSPDLDAFWDHVRSARDLSREAPEGRWLLARDDAFAPGAPSPDHVYATRGCFVADVPDEFDGLAVDAELLARLDPLVRIAVAAARRAFEDGVTLGLDRERVGVVLGNIALPTEGASKWADRTLGHVLAEKLGCSAPDGDAEPLDRYVAGFPAGVIATALGLGGGCHALDAACASSLYAVQHAMAELTAGRVDAMLAGGVSRPDCLYTQMGFSQLRALSPTGRCAPFDARGDGLLVGEGAGVFLLKRLDDAVAAGDRIYAVLRGVGLSNDVEGNLLAPSSEGQLRALRAAYAQAGWRPSDVDLIECHATGTPVGDAVEFASLTTLWEGEPGGAARCVLGSVKSNVGHLLTGAGAAGLLKVLLALAHEELPPSANFERAGAKIALDGSPFTVLAAARPWTRRAPHVPRRAAVSAFGFGGINAHLLVEEWLPGSTVPAVPRAAHHEDAAIVGVGAWFGPWDGLASVTARVLGGGERHAASAPAAWWGVASDAAFDGHRIADIALPRGRFRIPPTELAAMLPQQALLLEVTRRALVDAGLARPEGARGRAPEPRLRTGVYVGMGLDLETTNFHVRWSLLPLARRLSRERGLPANGPEFESYVRSLRDAFGPALDADRVIGALGGIVASRVAREFRIGGPSFALSSEETSGLTAVGAALRALARGDVDTALVGAVDLAGELRAATGAHAVRSFDPRGSGPVGEGAAALVLKRLDDARRDGDRVHAVLRGFGAAGGAAVAYADDGARVARIAAERALADAGVASEDVGYVDADGAAPFAAAATGDVTHDLGRVGAASGLAGIVKAVAALRHAVLPDRDAPRAWLRDRERGPRRAAVLGRGVDGSAAAVVLEEAPAGSARDPLPLPLGDLRAGLFVVSGDDDAALARGLAELSAFAGATTDSGAHRLARDWWRRTRTTADARLAVALVARDRADLEERIALARRRLAEPDRPGADGRVALSRAPLGGPGRLAFVFPGSANHFLGMGRALSARWPQVLRRHDDVTARLRSQLVPQRFWEPGGADGLDDDHHALIFGQVALGAFMSDVVRGFGVEPAAAIGYSLGETASLFALGAWKDRDEMDRRMRASTLFTRDLCGPCDAARRVWDLPADEAVDWVLGVVDRPADVVRDAVSAEARVRLLIVNTPQQCVIGGQRGPVARVVARLGAQFVALRGVTTVHCDVVEPVREAYEALHRFAVTPPPGIRFHSCGWARPYEIGTDACAQSIVDQALHTVDFPAVIERAYDEGVRVFLEIGPGASCTRMIGDILAGRPHAAVAVCVPERDGVESLLAALARLVAERVTVDLSQLYDVDPPAREAVPADAVVVRPGAGALDLPDRPRPRVPVPATPTRPDVRPAPRETAAAPSATRTVPDTLAARVAASTTATAAAHDVFLRLSRDLTTTITQNAALQTTLARALGDAALAAPVAPSPTPATSPAPTRPVFLDRAQCLEIATGSIGDVLGAEFAPIDAHPTRVRLPDQPLMLVDRVLTIEGEARSMTGGRIVTEHDVLEGAWYLDHGRIPTCIAVEAGQADLFLSGWLGIDFLTKGLAVYRLLDAVVTFHAPLPRAGATIRYDIRIDHFFNQGATRLFRFRFEATVDGRPVLSMREGCAGFFTTAELDAGKGIVQRPLDLRPQPGVRPADSRTLAPFDVPSTLDPSQLEALRRGDLAAAFGPAFAQLPLRAPSPLPGGRMTLIHRVTHLEPRGGRCGLGYVRAEADVRPDDWYLTCHFVDDKVMPGTLMYECSLHTLRVFLLRMGWVGEADRVAWEPVPETAGRLRCRGQVTEGTRVVAYEVTVKELGYGPEPYAIADALMYADGRPIVQMVDMSLRLAGTTRTAVEALWDARGAAPARAAPLYDSADILAFAVGKPSEAFGERYRVFDAERVIARLPGPPFQFLDRVTSVDTPPWELRAGGTVVAAYDVPPDAWYFASSRMATMPFAVLLEAALQPCGWFAAYMGSALTSDVDLKFRNLGGKATLHRSVGPDEGELTTTVRCTDVSRSGGMIIQHFALSVRTALGPVYDGTTYFGFFTGAALRDQVGMRERTFHELPAEDSARATSFALDDSAPYPLPRWRMVSRIDQLLTDGGPNGLGYVRASTEVDPSAWFFAAHFHQDPVWPGSLGLESLLQVLTAYAVEAFGASESDVVEALVPGTSHAWTYRGQILPADHRVTVEAVPTAVDPVTRTVTADGLLGVDGRIIYEMRGFSLRMAAPHL